MTPVNPMEKCCLLISKIRTSGFLNYFLNQFTVSLHLCDITKSEEEYRWSNNGTHFWIVKGLQWDTTSNSFIIEEDFQDFSLQQEIEQESFLTYFSKHYAIPLHFKTVQKYIQITRDEYKNAWFLDKYKQCIYFKFRHMCGEGAVKRTYFGWNVTTNKPVAVYQINLMENHTEIKRCLNEKRIAEIEKSPYLLTIHYSTCHKDTRKVYMVADFCKHNVKQMIQDSHPWSIQDLKMFSRHILHGLKVLHDMGIIHRDVKPSNIIYDEDVNIYKLIDFGVATKYSSNSQLNKIETINHQCESDTLSLVGTPGYISPEMYDCLYSLNKMNYNNNVDIFSFGITLLEMYFKERAFVKDFQNLPQAIKNDLSVREAMFNNILQDDTIFLQESFQKVCELIKTKRLESLKSEIQEKIDIINQLNTCEGEEKNMFVSELIDKNKSICYYCKKIPESLKDLDENTSVEYEFITKMKTLQHYCYKWDHFTKQSIDDMVESVDMYPLLFLTSSYTYPIMVNDISDPVFRDFLIKCLDKNPSNRYSIEELLQHEWLS